MNDVTIDNARIVTPEAVIHGRLVVTDGRIAAIEVTGTTTAGGFDLEGDYLIPGLVEVHTDNLERQVQPRPKVRWPADAALLAHDGQIAAAGITTVCDAICVGFYGGKRERLEFLELSLDALDKGRAAGVLKAEHLVHLRCEVSDPDVVDIFADHVDHPDLRVVSLMDHTPGQRQWHDLERYRTFHRGRSEATDDEFEALVRRRIDEQARYAEAHRQGVLDLVAGRDVVLASHDDTTVAHVAQAHDEGCRISEFPTTTAAAEAARAASMAIVMGAPNVILGGSHSGNVSALSLAAAGLLDGLSSDYVPVSMVHAAFVIHDRLGWSLPRAIAPVTSGPAAMLGLDDRGALTPGLRADLVRVRHSGDVPTVQAVWREGRRVA
ncbi:MAG: alpha-D-ribose 1-methylphosphonate 5-triphosphate diphosphatase [Pseudomonadota bacterium]